MTPTRPAERARRTSPRASQFDGRARRAAPRPLGSTLLAFRETHQPTFERRLAAAVRSASTRGGERATPRPARQDGGACHAGGCGGGMGGLHGLEHVVEGFAHPDPPECRKCSPASKLAVSHSPSNGASPRRDAPTVGQSSHAPVWEPRTPPSPPDHAPATPMNSESEGVTEQHDNAVPSCRPVRRWTSMDACDARAWT